MTLITDQFALLAASVTGHSERIAGQPVLTSEPLPILQAAAIKQETTSPRILAIVPIENSYMICSIVRKHAKMQFRRMLPTQNQRRLIVM
jgi:hypothetical protein